MKHKRKNSFAARSNPAARTIPPGFKPVETKPSVLILEDDTRVDALTGEVLELSAETINSAPITALTEPGLNTAPAQETKIMNTPEQTTLYTDIKHLFGKIATPNPNGFVAKAGEKVATASITSIFSGIGKGLKTVADANLRDMGQKLQVANLRAKVTQGAQEQAGKDFDESFNALVAKGMPIPDIIKGLGTFLETEAK